MKARVKATGEIITIESDTMFIGKNYKGVVKPYYDSDIDIIKDEPDYWKKLKHQYAGMAMQGILSSDKMLGILGMQKGKELDDMIGDMSVKIATTLVNRLKEDKQ